MGCSRAWWESPEQGSARGHTGSPERRLGWEGHTLHRGCSGKHLAISWQQRLAELKRPEAAGENGGSLRLPEPLSPPYSSREKEAPCCRAGMQGCAPPP